MIFLEHVRFVIDHKTEKRVKTLAGEYSKVQYYQDFDFTTKLYNENTSPDKITLHIKEWEKDHYGMVTVYDDDFNVIKKVSNRHRFKRDMILLKVIVKKSKSGAL